MKSFYDYLIIITVILYILVLVGLFNFAPNLLKYVNNFTKIYISFMLFSLINNSKDLNNSKDSHNSKDLQ